MSFLPNLPRKVPCLTRLTHLTIRCLPFQALMVLGDPRGHAVRVTGNVRAVFSPQMWRNTKSDVSNQQRSVSLVATSGLTWYRLGAKSPEWIDFIINFILFGFFFWFLFWSSLFASENRRNWREVLNISIYSFTPTSAGYPLFPTSTSNIWQY